jgi:hypothetical protein
MKSKLPILLLGCLLGAGLVQMAHVIQARKGAMLFERRLRCKGLAQSYEKDNSNEYNSVYVSRVDFSMAHNSCVASMEEINTAVSRQNRYYNFEVVDLLSGQMLFRQTCRSGSDAEGQSDFCALNGKDSSLVKARDAFLERELKRFW